MSLNQDDAPSSLSVENTHQELPYLIHSKTMVPYLVGRNAHTIIAVELKKFHWKIKLVDYHDKKCILATKGVEKWLIQVISTTRKLTQELRELKQKSDNEFLMQAEEYAATPVIALVGEESATLLSAKTFVGLSLS